MSVRNALSSASPVADRIRWGALAGALALSAGLAGAASAAPYNPERLPTDQLAQVGHICQSVIRVQPGEAHYVGCVESLSDSWRGLTQARTLSGARATCVDRGLKPDTPDLAECELRAAQSAAPVVRPISTSDGPVSGKSYFYASPSDVHRREELSCARLGLEPGSGGFASCVAGLQSAMFAADHPMN
jgi:hypothetical protein